MQTDINSLEQFNSFISSNKGAVVYFSTPDCNVCKVLKPKLIELIQNKFPQIKFGYTNITNSKELAAQSNVFSVPTILFFFEGKEFIRKARFVNFDDLKAEIARYYSLMFDNNL